MGTRAGLIAILILLALGNCRQATPASSTTVNQPCRAEDVLHTLGQIVASGKMSSLPRVILQFAELEARPEMARSRGRHAGAAGEFDTQVLQAASSAIADIRKRHSSLILKASRLGDKSEQVHLEGTEFFADRIEDSALVFNEGGRETRIGVASLIRLNECWKLEHFGTGVIPPPHERTPQRQRKSVEKPGASGFRQFAPTDYCTGLSVYRTPDVSEQVGTLVEGYRRYRDPKSGKVFQAVMVSSLATGHVTGIWMSPNQLSQLFVDRADTALHDCAWSVRDKNVVSPLPDETPALAPQ